MFNLFCVYHLILSRELEIGPPGDRFIKSQKSTTKLKQKGYTKLNKREIPFRTGILVESLKTSLAALHFVRLLPVCRR